MAFFGRLGSILRQATNRQIMSESRPSPYVFQAIRGMCSAPTTKVFIGGVSFSTDEQGLREAFSRYGEVVDARIIMDRETGRSRGFGFITFNSVEEASSAIQALDGQELHGRRVRVNYANERPSYGGGGGSYGNTQYGGGGGYGAPSYGDASSGGGGYGGNVDGGYGGGRYGGGPGGSYGQGGSYGGIGAANNYSSPQSFETSHAGGSQTSYGNDGNITSGSSGLSDDFGGAGIGAGSADGYGGVEYGSSGQFGSNNSGSVNEDFGGVGDIKGNYKEDNDDTDIFAKRA